MKRTSYNKPDLGKSFGVAVAIMLVMQILLGTFFAAVRENDQIPDWAFWMGQAIYALALGSVALIYAALTKADAVRVTKLNVKPPLAHVGWGCLATLFLISAMLPLNEFLIRAIVSLGFSEPSVDVPLQVVPMVLIACILPAFTEELIFRGTIASCFEQSPNKWASVAAVGALFAVFHLNPAQTLHQFVLGGFLALLFLRSGSLWVSVIVHLLNNLVAVVLTFTLGESDVFVRLWYVFIPVGLIGFAVCIFGYVKTTKCREVEPSEAVPSPSDKYSKASLIVSVVICAILWIVNLVS